MSDLLNGPALSLIAGIAIGLSVAFVGQQMRSLGVTLTGCTMVVVAALLAAFPVAAQAQADLNAEIHSLMEQAQARANSARQSVRDWASDSATRGEAYKADAAMLARSNDAKIKSGMKMLGDTYLGDANRHVPETPEPGALYVAVSLSMPTDTLRKLADDAEKAHAKVVIRGLVDGSFIKTAQALHRVYDPKHAAGIAIDPQVFRAFKIERVPTFISATGPVEPCQQGLNCTSSPTPHDQIEGNISLAEALRRLSKQGVEAAAVARAALAQLGE